MPFGNTLAARYCVYLEGQCGEERIFADPDFISLRDAPVEQRMEVYRHLEEELDSCELIDDPIRARKLEKAISQFRQMFFVPQTTHQKTG